MHRRFYQLIGLGLLSFMSVARADMLYTLDQGGSCCTGTFGTVLLHSLDPDTVQVTEILALGDVFANSAGKMLQFTIDEPFSFVPGSLTPGFISSLTGGSAPPFGHFGSYVTCPASTCGGGTSGLITGPLTFEVYNVNGLKETDFIGNPQNFFASDIGVPSTPGNFNTGNVTALVVTAQGPPPPSTPEPSSMMLCVLGSAAILWARRRFSA